MEETLEVVGEVVGAGIAILGLLGERLQADGLDVGRQVRANRTRRLRLGVEDEVEVVLAEASEFLRRYAEKQALVFDIVFFDPPYATDYEGVLKYFGEHATRLLAEDSLVIVEHHKKRDLKEKFSRVHRYRTLKQGDSLLSFYQMT